MVLNRIFITGCQDVCMSVDGIVNLWLHVHVWISLSLSFHFALSSPSFPILPLCRLVSKCVSCEGLLHVALNTPFRDIQHGEWLKRNLLYNTTQHYSMATISLYKMISRFQETRNSTHHRISVENTSNLAKRFPTASINYFNGK